MAITIKTFGKQLNHFHQNFRQIFGILRVPFCGYDESLSKVLKIGEEVLSTIFIAWTTLWNGFWGQSPNQILSFLGWIQPKDKIRKKTAWYCLIQLHWLVRLSIRELFSLLFSLWRRCLTYIVVYTGKKLIHVLLNMTSGIWNNLQLSRRATSPTCSEIRYANWRLFLTFEFGWRWVQINRNIL